MQGGAAQFGKMKTIAWRPPGQARGKRGRPAFEVRTRSAHRVGIDHHTGIAEGDVFIRDRSLHGLIVDARVGHRHAELDEGFNGAPFEIEHGLRLTERGRLRKVSAARIGDGRNTHLLLALGSRCQALQPKHTGLAETFRVGHDVRLGHRNEIRGAEELADRFLVRKRLLRQDPGLAGQDILFFVVELHAGQFIPVNPGRRRNHGPPCPT